MSKPVYSDSLVDRLIAKSLTVEAERIESPPGMASKVGRLLRTDAGHRKPPLTWIPGRKRIVTVAACLALAGAAVFMTSPGLQAWAADQANQLINYVQVTLSVKNGGNDVSIKEIAKAPAGAVGHPEAYQFTGHVETLAQAEKTVGFHIQVPSYLPAGYQVPPMIGEGSIMKSEGQSGSFLPTGKYQVDMIFDRGRSALPGLALEITQIWDSQPGLQYTAIQVNGQPAKWFDNALAVNNTSSGQQQTVTEHVLSWTEGGLQYTLTSDSGLPMAEMVKIAESLK